MDLLIAEVQKRPILWNKWQFQYRDKPATDEEWLAVAKTVGMSKEEAKRKWKNLRDHFMKEIKRIPKSRSGNPQPSAEYYKGKWCYFKQMLFLNDPVRPKPAPRDLSKAKAHRHESSEMEEVSSASEDHHHKTTIKTQPSTEERTSFTEEASGHPMKSTEMPKYSRPRKQPRLTVADSSESELIKMEVTSRPAEEKIGDEDLLFLQSLYPFFKQLEPLQKLRVRNEFHEILIREISSSTSASHFLKCEN